MADREQMNVRVLAPVKRELEALAVARGVSLNRLIEDMCEKLLKAPSQPDVSRPPEQKAASRALEPAPKKCPASSRLDHNFCTVCRHIYPADHWEAAS